MSPEVERIGRLAQTDPKLRFTALAHHLDEEFLRETWEGLNKRGAAGVDGVSMSAYAENLDVNLKDLVQRLKAHNYQAPNVRRTYIPKAGNPEKLRPLGIPTVGSHCTSTQGFFGILGAAVPSAHRMGPGAGSHTLPRWRPDAVPDR